MEYCAFMLPTKLQDCKRSKLDVRKKIKKTGLNTQLTYRELPNLNRGHQNWGIALQLLKIKTRN